MEEKKTNIPRSNGSKRNNSNIKKRKIHLKKSVRRTIGALLLVSSLIVAAIPTGSVSATDGTKNTDHGTLLTPPDATNYYGQTGNKTSAPELDDILDDAALTSPQYYHTTGTSVPLPADSSNTPVYYGGLPLQYTISETDNTKYIPKEISIPGLPTYYAVDMDGFNGPAEPIYVLGAKNSTSKVDYIKEYFGDEVDYMPGSGKINLVAGYTTATSSYTPIASPTSATGKPIEDVDGVIDPSQPGKKWRVVERIIPSSRTIDGSTVTLYQKVLDCYAALPPQYDVIFATSATDMTPFVPIITVSEGSTVSAPGGHPAPPTGYTDEEFVGWFDFNGNPVEGTPIILDSGDTYYFYPKFAHASSSKIDGFGSTADNGVIYETYEMEKYSLGFAGGMSGILLAGGRIEYETTPSKTIYVCDIPDPSAYKSVTKICDHAFENKGNCKNVDLPAYVSKIGDSSFKGSGVESITLGNNLTSIGKEAFRDCVNLKTVYYHEIAGLDTIGDGAFAGTISLTRFTIDYKKSDTSFPCYDNFSMPWQVKHIGSAAFYGSAPAGGVSTDLGFEYLSACELGDYVFAHCNGLKKVDFYIAPERETSTDNIYNLGKKGTLSHKSKGTFADCENLESVTLSHLFNGTLEEGTFGNCAKMTLLKVKNGTSDFADGEFKSSQIVIEGPEPASMAPGSSSIQAYDRCLKIDTSTPGSEVINDYTYRYRLDVNSYVDYVNQPASKHGDSNLEYDFILQVKNDGTVVDSYDRNVFLGACDLEIYDNAGPLYDPIYAIGKEAFKKNEHIADLTINENVKTIGESAFEENKKLENIRINTSGTKLEDKAFYNNGALRFVTFSSLMGGDSSMGKACFGETPVLEKVRFLDDDYEKGNKDAYARFPSGSIAEDAFWSGSRTSTSNTVVFVGPMIENYAPYEFAIRPTTNKGTSDYEKYIEYRTGNPYNLVCQYKKAFTGEDANGVTGISYPSGVYLLSYPNKTSYVDKEVGGSVSVRDIEAIPVETRSKMQSDIIDYTANITVPYGIDRIDIVESVNNDPDNFGVEKFGGGPDRTGTNLYDTLKNPVFKTFQYVPELETVVFAKGGPKVFPDMMFKSAPDLTAVIFNEDVDELGNMPFFYGDSEDRDKTEYIKTLPHVAESPSKIETVLFNRESDTGKKYTCNVGVIKSYENGKVTLEEILPTRGKKSIASLADSIIDAEDIGDVTQFKPYAARDCDSIQQVDISSNMGLTKIAEGVFYDCDKLSKVYFPDNGVFVDNYAFGHITNNLEVTFPGTQVQNSDETFAPASLDKTSFPYVKFLLTREALALMNYADEHDNIEYDFIPESITLIFKDHDGTTLKKLTVTTGDYGYSYAPADPVWAGHVFTGWKAQDSQGVEIDIQHTPLYEDTIFTAQYGNMINLVFNDYDGKLIYKTIVDAGVYGINYSPADPTREGYVFMGWKAYDSTGEEIDIARTALYEDTIFTATYEPVGDTFIVKFVDPEGELIVSYPVKKGEKATQIPEGYTGWKPDPTLQIITEDTTFKATGGGSSSSSGSSSTSGPKEKTYLCRFISPEGWLISKQYVKEGEFAVVPVTPNRENDLGEFMAWYPDPTTTPIYESTVFVAYYAQKSSSSSSKSSSSSTKGNSGSSSSSTVSPPIYISGQDGQGGAAGAIGAAVSSTVYVDNGNGSGNYGGGDSGSGNSASSGGKGKTSVVSTAEGITDVGKMSATVNGSSDNYVVKVTKTQEADDMARAALTGAFGENVNAVRYVPFDISLYDSTGNQKISPVPEGVSVSITIPIPDDLAIYGGNAKAASTVGGVLENIQPRFTVINSVPCMTFTCTHLSPYVVYVDTANLTATGIADDTPKTADGIHPKWFLCIGLAAFAVVLFLKRDPEEYRKKRAV